MPNKKGTDKVQTPKKAKRIIKIKRKSSGVVTNPIPKKTIHEKKKGPRGSILDFEYKGQKYSLTEQQYLFCEAYLTFQKTAAQSIVDSGYNVYGEKGGINWNLARKMGSENLSKGNIRAYVNNAIDIIGLSDDVIRREHAKLILQSTDLAAKSRGLDMYYKKTGEYAPEKQEHSMDKEITEALLKVASLVK
jgi:hypothetical protein